MDDRRRRFEAQALPHLDAAYNLARWLSRSPTDADDIVQDAMLRAFRGFRRLCAAVTVKALAADHRAQLLAHRWQRDRQTARLYGAG